MQKHNRYLVWTIWVATIAFIGAGFVGWGSFDFGSKAGNVAKVGEIEIPQSKLNMVYSNLYNEYNQKMQGQLDEAKAKELGLVQQAFATIAVQAKILNFAKENGIIVSDEEVAERLQTIKFFQEKGVFKREFYDSFLKSQRLTAKDFEKTLREELTIAKTLDLLNVEALPFEEEVFSSAFNIADRLSYTVLSPEDINVTIDDTDVKAYWETQKENFMTEKQYRLSVVWTESSTTEVTEQELKSYFTENSFNYTDASGKQLSFEEAKENVARDLKVKKTKKSAQKAYIAYKKGNMEGAQLLTLSADDLKFTKEIWDEIKKKSVGDILKPKVVTDRYATVKIEEIIQPRVKHFEEAKAEATALYEAEEKKKRLLSLAEEKLKNFEEANTTISPFLSLNENVNLEPLDPLESLQFIQKLFTSTEEKGMISVSDSIVIYKVKEQKVMPLDEKEADLMKQTVNQLKKGTFENNLIKLLDRKYPTEVYMQGLVN